MARPCQKIKRMSTATCTSAMNVARSSSCVASDATNSYISTMHTVATTAISATSVTMTYLAKREKKQKRKYYFWRGFVQRCLSVRWGADAAFVVTTLVYALVHLPSMNFMLIMAALTCGICWGGLYRLFPKHLPAIVLSHALWDAAAFVWFPI